MRIHTSCGLVAIALSLAVSGCGGGDGGTGPPATGTVTGTVEDAGGMPLAGREVALRQVGASSDRGTATTNASGAYTFSSVPVGNYTVRVITRCGESSAPSAAFTVSAGATSTADLSVAAGACLLSAHAQPIFGRSCGIVGCHSGGAPEEGLNLSSAAQTIATAVNVPANQAAFDRIEPGFARQDSSYLVCKIEASCPQRSGARMPLGCSGASCLSAAQIDTIKVWIAQGALNN